MAAIFGGERRHERPMISEKKEEPEVAGSRIGSDYVLYSCEVIKYSVGFVVLIVLPALHF